MTADVALLQRLERTAALFVAAATVAAALLGGLDWAGGVLGGGALAAISYWAIRSSVDAMVRTMGSGSVDRAGEGSGRVESGRPGTARLVVTVIGRHALLALVAYVIIVRLRLHPVGVLTGASAVVLAAAREAVRGPS